MIMEQACPDFERGQATYRLRFGEVLPDDCAAPEKGSDFGRGPNKTSDCEKTVLFWGSGAGTARSHILSVAV
jgi:hypothetical protein